MKTFHPKLTKSELFQLYIQIFNSDLDLIFLNVSTALSIKQLHDKFEIGLFGDTFKLFYADVVNSKK